jgi:hypothetical protein
VLVARAVCWELDMAGGLLDFFKSPEGQGLLAAGFGAAAGARPGQPWNTLGRGGLAGLAGYANAQEQQSQEQQRGLLAQEREQMRSFRDLQMGQMKTQMEREQGQQAWRTGLPDVMKQATEPTYGASDAGPTMAPADPAALQKYAMAPNSPFADEVLKQQLFPKAADYKVVGNSLVQLGQGGVKPVYTAPDKPEAAPSSVREYQFAQGQGYQGSYEQFQREMKRAGASNVSVNTRQETEEAKTVGKFFGDDYAKVQQSGFTAQSSVNRLGRLEQLLDGVDTGKFAPLGLEVAKAAKAAGLNIDDKLSNKEAAVALSSEIALQLRNPAGGAGMPGAMSDADRNFLSGMVPGIEKTPEGRKLIIETGKKLAKRDIEVARLARDYRKQNGSIDEGFYDGLSEYSAKNPLFGAKTTPQRAAGPFQDPAKEAAYQQWKSRQGAK